jgi:hypothetical protein
MPNRFRCRSSFDLTVCPQTAFDALKHLALDEPDKNCWPMPYESLTTTGIRFSSNTRGNKKHAQFGNTVLGWIEIDDRRLIAEVNAERLPIRTKIEAALSEGIRDRASEIEPLKQCLPMWRRLVA